MQEEDLRRPPLELPNLKDIKHLVYSINYLRFATLEGSRVADPNPNPDPHVFGPPGSFYHHTKYIEKP
jgi:hypothetical protein